MTLRERIGVDLGGRRRLEDGLAWAAANGVHYVDMCLEGAPDHPNAPAAWTPDRVAALRRTCERHRIHLGLHSASAVNVAETSPLLTPLSNIFGPTSTWPAASAPSGSSFTAATTSPATTRHGARRASSV
jgi:hypothetical protein